MWSQLAVIKFGVQWLVFEINREHISKSFVRYQYYGADDDGDAGNGARLGGRVGEEEARNLEYQSGGPHRTHSMPSKVVSPPPSNRNRVQERHHTQNRELCRASHSF